MNLNKLTIFIERMKKLGIDIMLSANYPWIYIDTINGNKIKEKLHSDHFFTIGFTPVKVHEEFTFTDIGEIFKIIRKYR